MIATPSGPVGFASTSLSFRASFVSPNSRLPAPATIGKTISRYSSTEAVPGQRVDESGAAVDEDVSARLLLQLRDLCRHVTGDDGRVVPRGIGQRRGDDVLRHAVHLV